MSFKGFNSYDFETLLTQQVGDCPHDAVTTATHADRLGIAWTHKSHLFTQNVIYLS